MLVFDKFFLLKDVDKPERIQTYVYASGMFNYLPRQGASYCIVYYCYIIITIIVIIIIIIVSNVSKQCMLLS